ncbi:hypothetical protein ACRRTK_006605 [Alexandromys fortis]
MGITEFMQNSLWSDTKVTSGQLTHDTRGDTTEHMHTSTMPQESERTTSHKHGTVPSGTPCAEATSGEGKIGKLLLSFPREEGIKAELSPRTA